MVNNLKKIFLIFIFAVLLAGCGKTKNDVEFVEINKEELSNIQPTPGGTITIPIINYHNIDPLNPSNSSIYYFTQLIYDSLFEYNEDGTIETNLVEHYVLSPDNMTLTITLKDNIFWHNGEKLTTSDIVYTFNKIMNAEIKGPYYKIFKNCIGSSFVENLGSFMTMEIFDDRNIDIHFDKPYAECLDMLTFPIVKEENEANKIKLVGSGAYKLKEIKEGISIELERNDKYHGKIPYIMHIVAKIFDDENLAQLAFETGQVNVVKSTDFNWAKYQDNQRIKIEEYNSNEMDLLIFNNQRDKFKGETGRKIKQAISRAVNKKRIIDRLYLGKAIETSIPLNINKMNFYGLKSDNYYNEELAKSLLKEIGYTKLNENGFLINDAGETINIHINTNFSNKFKRIVSDFIIQDLRAIGINAYTEYKVSAVEEMSSQEIQNEKNKFRSELNSGTFDMALVTINLTEMSNIDNLLHTNSIGSGLNYSLYSNENLDIILDNLKIENDFEKRKEQYLKAIEIFSQDVPIVPLYIKINALLIDENLQGEINPIEMDLYHSFRNVFILKQFQ